MSNDSRNSPERDETQQPPYTLALQPQKKSPSISSAPVGRFRQQTPLSEEKPFERCPGHTAISTSTFYSVPKERPKRFVHANLLDVINPNESDFSADEKRGEKVSGDSSDEGDAIQTEVEEAEEEVATSTDAPPVDRILQNMKRRYTWVKKDFDIEAGSFENNFPLPPAEPLSAVEYFDMFVSRSMLKAVVDESNKYYFQKHGATLNLTVKELTSALGMFFRMGLVNVHRMVWACQLNPTLPPNPNPTRENWEAALLGCQDLAAQ
ncbi:hypothetical protein HPB51_022862 [Rhipicephalus microplus]|uniref:PiggyBac transposable element-derived protein domain-containing protein n=1 Tax=Rhipicephalus microplus TaxID=6941 RepID=A0A9J6DR87_RHIMP|nr:hypothetical protein HPB51_022862 [Rhipicephalus microplus]